MRLLQKKILLVAFILKKKSKQKQKLVKQDILQTCKITVNYAISPGNKIIHLKLN